jgi:hypothetical protein
MVDVHGLGAFVSRAASGQIRLVVVTSTSLMPVIWFDRAAS